MPNRSNTSRSYQSAGRQTPGTESISHSDSESQHFNLRRWLRSSECSRYTTSKRGSAGSQSTAVTALNRTKCCWSFKYRQTSAMRAGAIQSVGSLRSAWPPVIAPGSAASSASATAWSFNGSGSILFYPGFWHGIWVAIGAVSGRFMRPIQRALPPNVKESDQDQNHEDQHLSEPEQLQLPIHHRPRVQEHRFNVEKDKHDSHQIKLDAEAFPRRARGRHPGFIRRVLHAVLHVLAQQKGDRNQCRGHHHRDHDLHQHGEVGIRIGGRHSLVWMVDSEP